LVPPAGAVKKKLTAWRACFYHSPWAAGRPQQVPRGGAQTGIGPTMEQRDGADDKPKSAVSDEQLLLRYTQGDTPALEELIARYRRELFHFLVRFLGDPNLADDVFQETFLQVHVSAGGFDPGRRLKPWLFTIAANKARDALRSRQRRSAAPLDAEIAGGQADATRFVDLMPSKISAPDLELENRQTGQLVRRIVQQMPENLRTVLLLSYFQEFPYKEIAEILEVPLGTVKSRLHVAVKEFARRWKAVSGKQEEHG
jgi:RNA polymerase sigma-70 factor (ECF subfamily)